MVNNENAPIFMHGALPEDVNTLKYLGTTLKSDAASDNELRIRLAAATSSMVILNTNMEQQKYKFSCRIQAIQVTNVINTAIRVRNLDHNGKIGKKDTIIRE